MPAKKKQPDVDWHARAELAGRSALEAIHENDELRKRLAAADELLKSGQETMREHVQRMTELMDQLRELQVAYLAEERELDFWVDQADHYRNEVVKLLRERAAERPWSWPR